MLNYIKFFVYTSTLFFCSFGFGQSIWENPITGTNPNTDNPYTTGDVVDANISVSGIGRGTGINGTNANNRYNANGWNTGSIDLTAYFEWTLTPDTGCEIDFTSFVYTGQRSSTGPEEFAFRSSVDGFTSNIGTPTAGGTTLNLSALAYQNISGPITFRFYGWETSNSGGTFSINNFTFNGTTSCGPPPSNTITTGTVSPLTYNVDCTTGEAGTVGFTSTEVYNGGNVFTAELSDATGSFAAPTSIGTLAASGTDPSGTINITIPAGTATGTGYRIRVVSSDPVVTGTDNEADITINLTGGPCILEPPHMTSLIINSCNEDCDEGNNEVVFGNTGDYSVLMNSTNFELTYGTSPSPTTVYTDPLVSNTGTTDDLNNEANCPGLFVDATNTTIPPNSTFMLAHNEICPGDVLDFENLCGSGPIYVVYTEDPSWSLTGNFVNSSSGIRYLQTTITATDGSTHVIDYEFDSGLHALFADGDYAKWNANGGIPIEQGNNGCALDPVVLPIELLELKAYKKKDEVEISWSTLSERSNDYFILSHSTDGLNFFTISTIDGAGTSTNTNFYNDIHLYPKDGINYYRLQSVDFDGTTYLKGIRAVEFNSENIYYDNSSRIIYTNSKGDYNVVNLAGQIIKEGRNTDKIPFSNTGIYIVQNLKTGETNKLAIH